MRSSQGTKHPWVQVLSLSGLQIPTTEVPGGCPYCPGERQAGREDAIAPNLFLTSPVHELLKAIQISRDFATYSGDK